MDFLLVTSSDNHWRQQYHSWGDTLSMPRSSPEEDSRYLSQNEFSAQRDLAIRHDASCSLGREGRALRTFFDHDTRTPLNHTSPLLAFGITIQGHLHCKIPRHHECRRYTVAVRIGGGDGRPWRANATLSTGGRERLDQTRYPAHCRWRVQHGRGGGLHVCSLANIAG